MLKQAILVTTISANNYLSPGPRRYGERAPRKPRASFGALSGMSSQSSTSVYLPPTPPFQSGDSLSTLVIPPTKAHIVHVLPGDARSFNSFTRSKLVQSIESFLISYAYPATLDMRSSPDERADRPHPYIMTTSSLGERVGPGSPTPSSGSPYNSWPSDCSLVELVLCGSLDGEDPQSQPAQARALPRTTPRALLVRAADIVLLAEDTPIPPAVLVSQSEPLPSLVHSHTTGRLTRDSSPSSSSSSGTPKTPSSRSLSPGSSPLAKSERYISLNGLPTPPDSEESGIESEEVGVFPRKRVESAPAPSIPGDDTSSGSKSRKVRWRFWKRSSRASR